MRALHWVHRSNLIIVTVLAWGGVAAAPASAQIASALLREAEPLPGAPGETISSLNSTAVNHNGGYAVTVNSTGSGTLLSHVWGSASGAAGALLRTEGVFGDFQQTSFESFFGFGNAGQIGYSPSSTRISTGTTGLDGAWLDNVPVLTEEDPVPTLPGQFSTFNSRVGVTAGGQPYWVGGIANAIGPATQNRVLFFGTTATPVLMGNDLVAGVLEPIQTGSSNIDFDVRFSAMGSRYITPVRVASGSTANDGVVVIDGAAAMPGASVMREASPVPPAAGGLPAELWDNFDYVGITEAGDWLVTGDTNAATTQDEFVLLTGQIVLREGQTAGGMTINGAIEGGYLNEDADWAVIWDVDGPAANVEALLFNGNLVLLEGDLVDWNGDGVINALDNNGRLANFTGTASLTIGDRGPGGDVDIYFTADIDFNGTSSTADDLEGFFRQTASTAACTIGDVDGNGTVEPADIGPFVDVLMNPAAASPQAFCASDINTDGAADGRDVFGMVDLLVP